MKEYVLGIDLGTTNSCVAVYENGKARIIEIEGSKTMPSVVSKKGDADIIVGKAANNQRLSNSKNTFFGCKRLIGQKMDSKAVKEMQKNSPFSIIAGKNEQPCISDSSGAMITPEEIASHILRKLAACSAEILGSKVTKAVITVPAYFNDSQRSATKNAGKIAGLEVLRIINEPTAAALAYGMDISDKKKTIVVYDFGGGTFDVSIVVLEDKVFEVLATNGDTNLGGEKIDEKVMDYILKDFMEQYSVDLRKDSMALQRVKEAAEKAKKDLSSQDMVDINLPFITQNNGAPIHYTSQLSKAKFEKMVEEFINATLDSCKACLKDADNPQIDEVLLVGGSTKIPLVRKKVEEVFGKKPNHSLNPDEAVAIGAAMQGGILSGDLKDIVLLDVTPLTLGIETMGGITTPIITRNSSIPTKKSQVFSTAVDNQPSVTIHVTQGERQLAADNKSLGRFDLTGINSAPRGVPQIEVTFDIDTNGMLNISAIDKATGKKNNIVIKAGDGLTDADIEKMKQDGEKYADEDKKKKELIEAKNAADNMIYNVEKNLDNAGDAEVKTQGENLVKELKAAISSDDLEKMKTITTQLQEIATKLTPKQEPPKTEEKGGDDKESKDKEGAQEAEFTEVKNETDDKTENKK